MHALSRHNRSTRPTVKARAPELTTEPYSTIRLRDGRALGYREVGRADGVPVFHFHGHGSSRLEVGLVAEAAAECGIRLIGLDRPGVGRSDPKRDAGLLDWPGDVAAAADQLGIERFAVEGLSAGGPYALACAYRIPQRLTACGLISTVSPADLIRKHAPIWMSAVWRMAARFPTAFRFSLELALPDSARSRAEVEKRLVRLSCWSGMADQKLLRTPEIRARLAQAIVESRLQGARAQRGEAMSEISPWGFSVEKIRFEGIFLWHGEQDRAMPAGPARLLAQALPRCKATFYPGEGHLSVLVNRAKDIFGAMKG